MNTTGTWILGRLGKEPEMIEGQNKLIGKVSVASTEYFDGKEHTEWHSVVAFGQTAEFLEAHFHKGDPIFVLGQNRTSSWENKEGETRYRTDVIAQRISFCPLPPKNADQGQQEMYDDGGYDDSRQAPRQRGSERATQRRPPQTQRRPTQRRAPQPAPQEKSEFEDDIPF